MNKKTKELWTAALFDFMQVIDGMGNIKDIDFKEDTMDNNIKWLERAESLQEWMTEIRRSLHSHPETGFDLNNTVKYVEKKLIEIGYEPKRCGQAGLIAQVGKRGKTFLLRADMDALPVKEETGLPYASVNENMHACGHDLHTAMLLGAAKILKEYEEELGGTVKLMFQPAEEILEGAADMIRSGVLEDPQPEAAMMIHVMAGMPIPTGTILISAPGVSAPAADYFDIRVQGTGCHGAMPNTGIDPITAAAHIVIALQEITAREISVNDDAVITIGRFQGGNASNVIPDTVELGGTMRTYDESVRKYVKQRIQEISANIASAFRTKAEVSFGSGCSTLINDAGMERKVMEYLKEILPEEMVISVRKMRSEAGMNTVKSSGSEDFAEVSQKVPSIMLALAAGNPEEGFLYPQHHPKAEYDERVLPIGCAALVGIAWKYLKAH